MAANTDDSLVLSYLGLRVAVGVIGILLPFTLVFGKFLLESPGILDSISSYYYSIMGDVFVGSLCAIGVFLLSYRGYERADDIAGDIAFITALGVAFFPTTPAMNATALQQTIGTAHLCFAAVFFATLAFFALFLFRKTNPNKPMTPMKILRNVIYAVCGSVIVACILLIVLVKFMPGILPIQNPVFWCESVAIFFFGVSWFVKGEAILKDE